MPRYKPTHAAISIYVLADGDMTPVVLQRFERADGDVFLKRSVPSDVNGQMIEEFIPYKGADHVAQTEVLSKLEESPVNIDFDGKKVEE